MPSEIRRFFVYTDRGEAAADFEARVSALPGGDVTDEDDGRMYYLWTDEGELAADLEARFAAAGITVLPDLGEPGQRYKVFTRKGPNAADFEERMALLAAG